MPAVRGHRITEIISLFLMMSVAVTAAAGDSSGSRDALKDLKAGWEQQLIYEQTFVSPQALCCDDSGNLYVYEYGRKTVYRMTPDWGAEEFVRTGETRLRTIAWQPGHKRLIGFDVHDIYVLYPGPFRRLGSLDHSFMVSTVAVNPSDDSIFASYEEPGYPLVQLDADGKLLKVLKPAVEGCSQLAFDPSREILYYSETFKGSASALCLETGRTEPVLDKVAVAGTVEPVMIWLDGARDLWYYTANEGLFRAAEDGFRRVSRPMMGAGQIIWYPAIGNWVAIEYAGSNLLSFDYENSERVDLTNYLNANDITADASGRVFYPRYEFIKLVENGRVSTFAGPLPDICDHVEADARGFIYAALYNGAIHRFNQDGRGGEWAGGFHHIIALAYDAASDDIIAADRQGERVTVYRIPAGSPGAAVPVAAFTEEEGAGLKRLAVDAAGAVYLYDWAANEIYRVDEESGSLKGLYSDVLPTRDITVPGFSYSRVEDAFIIGTLEYYRMIGRQSGRRGTLAKNRHGADNFAVHENPDGSLFFIHSGQIFSLSPAQ